MKQKNMVLMVVAVGCGLVAAFLTTQINAKPKIETVDVLVAAKELPTGTFLTLDNIDKNVVAKKVPKEALPPQPAFDKSELVGKRLARAVRQDEVLNLADLKKGSAVVFLEGKDIMSMPMNAAHAAAGAVGPGSKVDVLASLRIRNKLEAFPLLVDMHILEVNGEQDLTKNPRFPNMSTVSFAVDQEEALLITLAKQRGCHLELLLRHPSKPVDPNYDRKKVLALLKDTGELELVSTEGKRDTPGGAEAPIKPENKPELVKVPVATEDIAPNTELTADLIRDKFKEKELLKEYAEGAYTDLTPFLGKSLRHGLGKGQWVTEALVGTPAPKPAPQDSNIDNQPKPGPDEKPVPKKEAPPTAGVETHDVAVHTASGTVVHRFQRPQGGAWKLVKVLSHEEAAAKPGAQAPKPATPDKQPAEAEKKLD